MFHKILIPLDLSDRHTEALRVSAELASTSGGEVLLLHVIEIIPGLAGEDEFYSRLDRVARAQLLRWADRLAKEQVKAQVEVVLGNRGREILRRAGEEHVDLMVLTAPQATADNPSAGLGSLSFRLSMFAPCPVLLVR